MRGATPTHTFTIPVNISDIKKVKIIYSQNDEIVVQKLINGSDITDENLKIRLTQEDTFKFNCNLPVEIQMRILMEDGETLNSYIKKVGVSRCLDDEVLE